MSNGPRSWDDRWLPRLAAVVQSAVARSRGRAGRLAGRGTLVGDGLRGEPALAGSIVVVAAAAIVLAAAGGPGGPSDGEGAGSSGFPATVPGPVTTVVGPAPGSSVASYLTHASFDLRRFGETSRGRQGYAVVDLKRYVPPAEAESLFAGIDVVRAYVRAPAPGLPTQVHAVPLQNTFAPLEAGMQASGRLAAATAHTFAVLVSQIHPHTQQDRALRQRYALQHRASAYEAGRLQQPARCACVFAVVLHADDAMMLKLARNEAVRAVDPVAAEVTLNALTVFPLEPEVTDVVPRGGLFGG